jgi:hypothetical protein
MEVQVDELGHWAQFNFTVIAVILAGKDSGNCGKLFTACGGPGSQAPCSKLVRIKTRYASLSGSITGKSNPLVSGHCLGTVPC